jgi:bifunctional enzyme CysN/CysC
MPWYQGSPLVELLADLEPAAATADAPARMRVQDVYREGETRIAVGRLDGGTIAAGDAVVVLPSGSRTTVRSIERWNSPERKIAIAGESIGLTFREPVYIARGDVISREAQPPALGYGFRTVCFWLAETPPVIGEHLTLQMGPTSVRVAPEGFEGVLDSGSLEICSTEEIPRYAVIELRLRAGALLAADDAARFVLLRGHDIAAGGFITEVLGSREAHVQPEAHLVAPEERARRNGHRGAVIWLTGLSASGKSTLATALERRLFSAGAAVYTLDGDNLRVGLNNDLGFSGEDRAENIRRVGEVAALFADAGMIVITAFISPMARDRALARRAAGNLFHEVYVRADLATCERRDPKGLYKKARAGEIAEFTGISAPYEPPTEAEFIIDTQEFALDRCVQDLFDYVAAAANLGEWIATRSI